MLPLRNTVAIDHKLFNDQVVDKNPEEFGYFFHRADGDRLHSPIVSNVPHRAVSGSPYGYEWGYGGSGPSDLALNICEDILLRLGCTRERSVQYRGESFDVAFRMRVDFRREFLEWRPGAGGVIPWEDAKAWVLEWLDNEGYLLRQEQQIEGRTVQFVCYECFHQWLTEFTPWQCPSCGSKSVNYAHGEDFDDYFGY